MTLLETMKKRCSVRKYALAPVEAEKIDYLLEAARVAPSAVNYQPWHFLVIKNEEGRAHIASCYAREWIQSAPCFILVCSDHRQSWKRSDGKDHADIDAAIAAEHICIAAAEIGLGTCWVCNFDTTLCRQLFRIPDHIEPVAILPVGYPADPSVFDATPKKRKSPEEIIHRETF